MLQRSVEKGPLASCCVNGRGNSCLGSKDFKTVSAEIRRIRKPKWDGRGGQRSFNDEQPRPTQSPLIWNGDLPTFTQ